MKTDKAGSVRVVMVFLGFFLWFIIKPGYGIIRNHFEIKRIKAELKNLQTPLTSSGRSENLPPDWQGKIAQAAKNAGLARLPMLALSKSSNHPELELNWEGSLSSTYRFLALLRADELAGPCVRLQLSCLTAGKVAGKASFRSKWSQHIDKTVKPSSQNQLREVFNSFSELVAVVEPPRPSVSQKLVKAEQERIEQEKKIREEAAFVENKKRQIETSFTVTGIVNNGRETMAFVGGRGSSGQTRMVRIGDLVDEARVASIDQDRGEVLLDYLGKTQAVLRFNPMAQANP